jgi:hypothetical protein
MIHSLIHSHMDLITSFFHFLPKRRQSRHRIHFQRKLRIVMLLQPAPSMPEGVPEGLADGMVVGRRDGMADFVGGCDGRKDGMVDVDGADDGSWDGALDGRKDGFNVGPADGFWDGLADGSADGDAIGWLVGKHACRPGVVTAEMSAAVVAAFHRLAPPKIHWLASNVLLGPLPGLR